MAKQRIVFFCTSCGHESPKWEGKCASCSEWNTYKEATFDKAAKNKPDVSGWKAGLVQETVKPQRIDDIESSKEKRVVLADHELNRTLGGGIVPGSITLIGGDPGIGKSTLLLQLALQSTQKVLYVSGEESAQQIKMRAQRIGIHNADCHILVQTQLSKILKEATQLNPDLLIVDSVQTIHSSNVDSIPGSISQVRECTASLQTFAKLSSIPVILIGHINKEGHIAGPKILEHIVDTVLQFEGDRNHIYRILRTKKNRFGSTDEMGIYAMESNGLRQVSNPSELLLSQSDEALSGSAIASTMEGLRPMLIECQALVSKSIFGNPQRSSTGFDLRRLNMLLAVLEKRGGLFFGQSDVFLNIAGGVKIQDTAMDLTVVAALISSLNNMSISSNVCFAGEVGLTGEIRAVSRIEQRVEEAARQGFEKIYISKYNLKGIKNLKKTSIQIIPLSKIEALLEEVFGLNY